MEYGYEQIFYEPEHDSGFLSLYHAMSIFVLSLRCREAEAICSNLLLPF